VIYFEWLIPFTFDSKRLKTGSLRVKILVNKDLENRFQVPGFWFQLPAVDRGSRTVGRLSWFVGCGSGPPISDLWFHCAPVWGNDVQMEVYE
jgi:hypothetical protein